MGTGRKILNVLAEGCRSVRRGINRSYQDYQEQRRIEEERRQYYLVMEKEAYYAERGRQIARSHVHEIERRRREQNDFPRNISDRTVKALNDVPWDDSFYTPKKRKKRQVYDYW